MIVTTREFVRQAESLANLGKDELWPTLNDLGSHLAMMGEFDLALEVWRFAYDVAPELAADDGPLISIFGDCAISAVSDWLGEDDFTKGRPKPKYIDQDLDRGERIKKTERMVRSDLTGYKWKSEPPSQDSHELSAFDRYRLVMHLLPWDGTAGDDKVQLAALGLLLKIRDDPDPSETLESTYRAEACIHGADIALRRRLAVEGIHFLREWYDTAVLHPHNVRIEQAYGLPAVALALCEGALFDRATRDAHGYEQSIAPALKELRARLGSTPERPGVRKLIADTHEEQLFLEPKKPDPDLVYFDRVGEAEQGFSCFTKQVAISTPTKTAACAIEVDIRNTAPRLLNVIQAVCFPLEVGADGLFVRTVGVDDDSQRLDVPAGRYDALARFHKRKPRRASAKSGLREWRLVLSFMPRGTVDAACIRLEDEDPPDGVVLNE